MSGETKNWGGPVLPPDTAELADRYAVSQLPKIYGLGLDMRDYALCRSAFATQAMAEGKQGLEPIDEYLPATYRTAASFHATQHIIANQYVTLNGDEAILWSYAVAHHKVAPGQTGNEIIAGVQYRNHCRRFPGGWLITEHRVVLQWMDRAPPRVPA
jgi:SnoaL-like protein